MESTKLLLFFFRGSDFFFLFTIQPAKSKFHAYGRLGATCPSFLLSLSGSNAFPWKSKFSYHFGILSLLDLQILGHPNWIALRFHRPGIESVTYILTKTTT